MADSDKKKASDNLKKKPGGTARDSSSQDLKLGSIYHGTVTAIDSSSGSCTVLTKTPGSSVENVMWATGGVMAPLLGFKTRQIPTLGSHVVILYDRTSFVIQVIPMDPTDRKLGNKKASTGDAYRADKKVYGDGIVAGPVVDGAALEGEFDISNAMNVGLLFLNNLMSLKAGDRAKVETHLLNDMVRIISETYRHHSAFGDFEIYNDGRLNVEWHGTNYEHESYNKSDAKEPKVPTKNTEVDLEAVEDSEELFKQRFSTYIGHLGDFIQLFVREPQETSSSVITGKAKFQIQSSGAVLIQSTDEIVFERVVRVVVPRRLKAYDDPAGNTYPEFGGDTLSTDPLIEWDYGTGNKNIHHVAYQLREYARYMSYQKSLARFRQQTKDFEVPTEAATPAPTSNNQEKDRAAVNGTTAFYETYSTIRMLRGGGIVLVAGDGSSLTLNNRQAVLSSVGKIILDAAGDIELNAGRSIYNTAYKDIHITSVTGGVMQKARKKFHILCERGLLWLKSDGSTDNKEGEGQGVFLDAAEGDLVINAKMEACMRSEEKDVLIKATKGSIIRKAHDNLVDICYHGINYVQALGGVLFQTRMFQFLARKILVNENLTLKATTIDIAAKVNIRNRLKVSGNIYGPEVWKLGKYRHNGHIRVLRGDLPVPPPQDGLESKIDGVMADANSAEEPVGQLDGSVWKYDDKDFPDQRPDGTYDSIYKPFSQDFLDTHPDLFAETHEDWPNTENVLKPATRTSPTMPYPGERSNQQMVHPPSTSDVLDKPSNVKGFIQTELEPEAIKKKRVK